MEKTSDIRVVFVATNSYESACQLARILVTEKLAACCSIVQNVSSVFAWEGKINERQEVLIIIKTLAEKLEILQQRIQELHIDLIPEIIALPALEAASTYYNWMKNTLSE